MWEAILSPAWSEASGRGLYTSKWPIPYLEVNPRPFTEAFWDRDHRRVV
tara:strand:- start:1003 stop:1149 length:147 start_codon:yes stop_codon:yes gene_type:complete